MQTIVTRLRTIITCPPSLIPVISKSLTFLVKHTRVKFCTIDFFNVQEIKQKLFSKKPSSQPKDQGDEKEINLDFIRWSDGETKVDILVTTSSILREIHEDVTLSKPLFKHIEHLVIDSAPNMKAESKSVSLYLPFHTSTEEIRKLFSQFGAISTVTRTKNPDPHTGKAVFWVNYHSYGSAREGIPVSLIVDFQNHQIHK